MIRFTPGAWLGTIFVFYGGVLPRLVVPCFLYSIYCCILYQVCARTGFSLPADGQKLIAGCTTFLLVFRVNQCYNRLIKAQDLVVNALCSLRSVVFSACAYTTHAGPKRATWGEAEHEASVLLKVHVVRLAVAVAVSLKFHSRMAEMFNGPSDVEKGKVWHALADLVRIKGLLTAGEAVLIEKACGLYEEEAKLIAACWSKVPSGPSLRVDLGRSRKCSQEAMGRRRLFGQDDGGEDHGGTPVPLVLLQVLRGFLMHPLDKPWGYPERFLNSNEMHLANAARAFEGLSQLILIPMPLPYLQLSKLLLCTFVLTYPLAVDMEHGIWGNVIEPVMLCMALAGFEIVSDCMENPLGDDPSDISVYEMIHEFEVECQAVFDLSVRDHREVLASQASLGEHLGLGEGARFLAQKHNHAEARRCFADFFEWSTLSRATILYINQQSGEVRAVNRRLLKETLQGAEGDDSDIEHFEREDPFTTTRCLALRGPDPHRGACQRQMRMLRSCGGPDKWHKSIREELLRAAAGGDSDTDDDGVGGRMSSRSSPPRESKLSLAAV
mmetsp:Transcript_60032/g.172320  ORF Transcript_60032/g.172320 Transcript_60032/m.172320 type:complete len:553 (+) Transcript_60032:132-1790(+)